MERRGLVLAPEALDELRAAASFAKEALGLTWRAYARQAGIARDRLEQFALGRLEALDNPETMRLSNYLRRSLLAECGFSLYRRFPVVFVENSLADHLVRELAVRLDEQDSFYREQKGYYLLFTTEEHDDLAVALLKVVRPPGQPLPWFVTRETTPTGSPRRASGFIFRSDERVVAIGRVSGSDQLRLSRLSMVRRGARADLCGPRLGVSPAGRDECRAVYCYKLGDEVGPGRRRGLTGVFPRGDLRTVFRFVEDPDSILRCIDRPAFRADAS